ncbi:MAG: hypothetical protein C7B46_08410 [Sulfobacillus benefaciens]|uniref:Uncharacterized protein n=1 Tax=Sulfobacillus benefaciens TaxID=453960 RepID=A0A2T2XGI9_9FIRM|nr:MAG: hypothetical protein C7B46_08410 [Sulfobacillus benefaciens]
MFLIPTAFFAAFYKTLLHKITAAHRCASMGSVVGFILVVNINPAVPNNPATSKIRVVIGFANVLPRLMLAQNSKQSLLRKLRFEFDEDTMSLDPR